MPLSHGLPILKFHGRDKSPLHDRHLLEVSLSDDPCNCLYINCRRFYLFLLPDENRRVFTEWTCRWLKYEVKVPPQSSELDLKGLPIVLPGIGRKIRTSFCPLFASKYCGVKH